MLVVLLRWPKNIHRVFYLEFILKETGHYFVPLLMHMLIHTQKYSFNVWILVQEVKHLNGS